ncbi:hypothetical protein [Pseudomonas sp. PA15(2017)]|uniref:hypothetical protein n=1 Tax=Pseudomonas sp. PA15(2017) TaxID=1932111 RepID=UPI00117B188F|nr:hypothetical protein [Pseudomonas sp. PA15(2017)]
MTLEARMESGAGWGNSTGDTEKRKYPRTYDDAERSGSIASASGQQEKTVLVFKKRIVKRVNGRVVVTEI